MSVTVISDAARDVAGRVDGERIVVDPAALEAATGWELKPQGLCRGDACRPVADPDALRAGDGLDLAAVAAALGRPVVVDPAAGVAAMALDPLERQRAVTGLQAPDFTLPDLDGAPHSLSDWRGSKKLLVAFASW